MRARFYCATPIRALCSSVRICLGIIKLFAFQSLCFSKLYSRLEASVLSLGWSRWWVLVVSGFCSAVGVNKVENALHICMCMSVVILEKLETFRGIVGWVLGSVGGMNVREVVSLKLCETTVSMCENSFFELVFFFWGIGDVLK